MQREDSGKMGLQVEMRVSRSSRASIPDPDMNWIVRNYRKLRTDYPDQWIAVKDSKVVESNPDLEPLLGRLKEKHGAATGFAIEFIGSKPRNLLI